MLIVDLERAAPASEPSLLDPVLERARQLNSRGAHIEIISARDFLPSESPPADGAGSATPRSASPSPPRASDGDAIPKATPEVDEDEADAPVERLFTTAQLSRILGVSSHRLHAWARQGLLRPVRTVRRVHYYDFAQVSAVRVLARLLEQGVKVSQIRRGLERLERWLPQRRGELPEESASLDQLEVHEGEVRVRLEDGRFADPDGQLCFSFDDDDEDSAPDRGLDTPVTEAFGRILDEARARRDGRRGVPSWFELGIEREESEDLEGAAEAYESAIDAGEANPEVLFNLGNVCCSLGRNERAYQCYLRVVKDDPDYVVAWNNLGNVLAAEDRWSEAIDAYLEAVDRSPDYPDPHYNLAEAYLAIGDDQEAWHHAYQYFRHDPHSSWAKRLRARFS